MDSSRKVTTTLNDVLSMVACSFDYGHANQIAWDFFWTLAGGQVSDREIETFLQEAYLSTEARAKGYGREEADAAKRVILEWRTRHQKGRKG